jgi:hypothetical protein
MTIVCDSRKFIFLKSRKTAGTSLELWLAPNLDPKADLISTGHELKEHHHRIWKRFDRPSTKALHALRRVTTFAPIFRQHMSAAEVRRFAGRRRWRDYSKISIVRNPWDRTLSLWRWRQHTSGTSISLGDFVSAMEKGGNHAREMGAYRWDNWVYYAIGNDVVLDHVIKYESLETDARAVFERFGISGGDLPRAKSGIRKPSDGLNLLTSELVDRIAVLHAREIETFGYVAPRI